MADEVAPVRKHPLAKCEDCTLLKVGRYVPSEGPASATIAMVGEAPGAQEARGGRPFVGPSGKLLERVMEEYGIERGEVLLTNACLCRPPDNATPPKTAIAACRPRLVQELEQRGVRQVVALGNSAAESLLGLSGVTKLRVGPGRPAKHNPDVRVISTLHPAAALRQADLFPSIVTDIGKLVAPASQWTDPRYVVFDDPAEAVQVLRELRDRTDLTAVDIDIEVDIDKDTGFDHPNQYGMLCVGIAHDDDAALVIGEEACKSPEVLQALKEMLHSKAIGAQNGKFDLAGLYPHVGALELAFDTMLAHYVLDERPGIHGLDGMAQEYLGAPDWKGVIKRYVGKGDGYGVVPREVLYKYNAYDVVATRRLRRLFEKMLDEQGLRHVHDFLVKAANQLMYLELNGIAIDKAYLDELTEKYLVSIDKIEDEMADAIGVHINPRSPMQVKAWLLEQKVEVDSTNEETLRTILEHPQAPELVRTFCEILLRHRKESKLYGTYVKGIRKRLYRGRVYPTFLLHGTTTGRLACRNPNLQNIPRDSSIRRLFVPGKPAENVFVHTDYSQAELRVLSFLAGDQYFRNIFATGRDLFDELTPVLYPAADKSLLGPAQWKELRIRVKAYVYGLAYGRSEYSIATEYKLSVEDAKMGMHRFFEVIPEIVEFREKTRTDVLSGKDLITPWGRHRRFWLITEENVSNVMNEALAFLPQSTASDMTLMALTNLRPKLRGIGFIRNIIHDAMIVECKRDDADMVAKMMDEEMRLAAEHIVGDYVPFATESTYGPSWGDV
jgi:uracil-DNA glycosylase family 4